MNQRIKYTFFPLIENSELKFLKELNILVKQKLYRKKFNLSLKMYISY